ncbi:unnamed protein product [Clonostachys rosea]|uniref:Rhodopsin domain-containing protein n=1 Tax=Bionectria ochroleuca TaxID=29856 RepID=A0ABY6UGU6_BIOOC|nr:unnamed protein product [Clonostachys rosea]
MYVLGEVDETFLQEVWILYGIGTLILVLRHIIRARSVGFKGLQGDDYFAMLVLALYTIDAVTVHNVYFMATNVEGSVIQTQRVLTDGEISQLVEGSKQELVAWYSYATLVWCLKGTMVCFFMRMTMGLSQQRLVNYIGIACIVSYVAVFLTITFGCFPVHLNWQVVPDPGRKCTLKTQNFFVMTVLNVITDAAILYVPLPLLWTLRVPIRQKFVIGILLSSGIFVIAAALIRIVSTLSVNPSALTVNRWGVRETLVGIIAVNVPILRPLFSKNFWLNGARTGSGTGPSTTGLSVGAQGPYEMAPSVNGEESLSKPNGSEENIITKDARVTVKPKKKMSEGNNVFVHKTYQVTNEANDGPNWQTGTFSESKATRRDDSNV